MKELILGLLGGGVVVQLLNLFISARPNRRRLTAEALDAEISALEHTLKVMTENIEIETRRHALERRELKEEILRLENRITELTESLDNLRTDNLRLRNLLSDTDVFKPETING